MEPITTFVIIFFSLPLFRRLCDQDVKITGAIKNSGLEKCPILNSKQLEKK